MFDMSNSLGSYGQNGMLPEIFIKQLYNPRYNTIKSSILQLDIICDKIKVDIFRPNSHITSSNIINFK